MTDLYFASLLVVGGVCVGFAIHAASLAAETRLRQYAHLLLLAVLQGAYCLVACKYLSTSDGARARPWGQAICAFTPYITFLFGELTMDLTEERPRWLVLLQRANFVLTTVFACSVIVDIVRGTGLMVEPELRTDLATLHRHQVVFRPLGSAYLGWVGVAFTSFSLTLFERYRARRELLPMVLGCSAYFGATFLDFGILLGVRDGLFVQHFGFFVLVIGCWRVISMRFETTLAGMQHAAERLTQQRNQLLIAAPILHKQKLDSLGTLAAGVAHEINNPIHGIMNYAHLLKRELDPDTPMSSFADEIASEGKRVANIVQSLLRFGRVEATVTIAVSVHEILDGTLTLIRTSLAEEGITLRVHVAEGLPEITCRAAQLQQVIMNLVANARDALVHRDPARTDEKRITIDVSQRLRGGEPFWVLEVSDTGDGFDPELSERIFEPFFTTKGERGTGLGLFVCHGIVKAHGGHVACESEPGRGARFRVELPYGPLDLATRPSGEVLKATPPPESASAE